MQPCLYKQDMSLHSYDSISSSADLGNQIFLVILCAMAQTFVLICFVFLNTLLLQIVTKTLQNSVKHILDYYQYINWFYSTLNNSLYKHLSKTICQKLQINKYAVCSFWESTSCNCWAKVTSKISQIRRDRNLPLNLTTGYCGNSTGNFIFMKLNYTEIADL